MASVKDGAIDDNLWATQTSPKVLHLLKNPTRQPQECTDPGMTDPWSLPELLRILVAQKNRGRKLVFRIAQRSLALQNGYLAWQDLPKAGADPSLGQALLKSALVNVEKTALSSTTSAKQVGLWARDNVEEWHSQIVELRPDVVLCGGIFDAVLQALGREADHSCTGMRFFRDRVVSRCVYLETPHPMARYPLAMVHTYLMASAKEILGVCPSS